MDTLTEKQDEIITYVVRYWGEHQSMPTLRQIGRAVGIGSPNGVVYQLKALARKGWVEVGEGTARGIRLPMLAGAVRRAAGRCVGEISRRPTVPGR